MEESSTWTEERRHIPLQLGQKIWYQCNTEGEKTQSDVFFFLALLKAVQYSC